jgi:hypothetical protein
MEISSTSSAENFQAWVGARSLVAPSTNAGAVPLPFQNWRKFKEAYSPELVAMAVKESPRKVRRLCDPFGGSGTSSLTAQFMGIESTSIEVNPYLSELIAAKVAKYDVGALISALPRVARRVQRIGTPVKLDAGFLPPTFVEPGCNGRWLFDSAVAREIFKLRFAIEQEVDPKIRKLFKVLLGGLLIEFSNAVVSGKGRRYRKNWQTRRADPAQVIHQFCDSVGNAIVEISASGGRSNTLASVICGDSREKIKNVGSVDLIVCSPPYPNSFDYTDVYNIELWMLGYLASPQANQKLRRSTLSSHVQIRREFAKPPCTPAIDRLMRRLGRVREDLWDENLVDMVGGYFADLRILLEGCAEILRPRGQAWFVVGNSQYAHVQVNVANILSELASGVGLKAVRQEPFRSMRLSPQQGGNRRLAESLVVLAKP